MHNKLFQDCGHAINADSILCKQSGEIALANGMKA